MSIEKQITEVYFERVFNLGNYETFRLGLHATVGAKQNVENVVAQLDALTVKMRNSKRDKKVPIEIDSNGG